MILPPPHARANQTHLTPREYIDDVVRQEIDGQADNIIVEMDQAGVAISVIFAVDYGLLLGEAQIHIFEQNRCMRKLRSGTRAG